MNKLLINKRIITSVQKGMYEHYKNKKLYKTELGVYLESTNQQMVVYKCIESNIYYTRPRIEFEQIFKIYYLYKPNDYINCIKYQRFNFIKEEGNETEYLFKDNNFSD